MAIFYVLANIALGIHLFHGTWSLFQSLGWNNPRFNNWRQGLAAGVATVIVVGNCSIPIAVQAGIIDFDPDAITCCVERDGGRLMTITLDSKIPEGPMAEKWDNFIAHQKLVNPANKRKFKVIVVGTGLAGASAAATMAELGYQVEAFTFHDSPRRGPLDRRPGRHQRGEELPGRRRQHLPPVLRHGEGRRLPRP